MYCDVCGYKNKDTAKFCKKCGASLEEEKQELEKKEDVEKVLENEFEDSQDEKKLDKKDLLSYLNIVKELEINKLGLGNSIINLHNLDKKEYARIIKPLKKEEKPTIFSSILECYVVISGIMVVLSIIAYIILFFHFGNKYQPRSWEVLSKVLVSPFKIIIPIVIGVYIITAFIGVILYKKNSVKYKKHSNKVDTENERQLTIYNNEKNIIDGRITNIDNNLKDTEKTLNAYYDLDVIYPKYRNLIAVTTFIEYLESGRCKSLYGYTGCYNVYEQELRQNVIIGKLDQVLAKLEQIKKMQFATYLAIQTSNALQSAFLNTCTDMLNEQRRANATLEAQAQDTKITERNSEIMATISTLNYIKHN